MSHGSPRHRKRERARRKDKRPKPEPVTAKAAPSPTAGIIAQLAKPTSAIAFAEALNEIQQKA
jgi:hypothetical protein